MQGLIYLIM